MTLYDSDLTSLITCSSPHWKYIRTLLVKKFPCQSILQISRSLLIRSGTLLSSIRSRIQLLSQILWLISPVGELDFAPNGCKPRLPGARETGWAKIVLDFEKSCRNDVIAPSVKIEETTISITTQTFLVISSRV